MTRVQLRRVVACARRGSLVDNSASFDHILLRRWTRVTDHARLRPGDGRKGNKMDDECNRRIRRRRYRVRRLMERARGFVGMTCTCVAAALCVIMAVAMPYQATIRARAATVSMRGCRASMVWPVAAPHVTATFDPPPQPWNSGHRGIDLEASFGDELVAPADGSIAFAGSVAGKSVVTIRHKRVTSTFEPAETNLSVGSRVVQGRRFAEVRGTSDHCDGECVHWGIKSGDDEYLDPTAQTGLRKIVLMPVTET